MQNRSLVPTVAMEESVAGGLGTEEVGRVAGMDLGTTAAARKVAEGEEQGAHAAPGLRAGETLAME